MEMDQNLPTKERPLYAVGMKGPEDRAHSLT